MTSDRKKRVVLTGIGLVSACGDTPDAAAAAILANEDAFRRADFAPSRPICPVEAFDLRARLGRDRHSRYLNRGARFAVAAALDAIENAKLPGPLRTETGVFLGAGPNLDIGGEFPHIDSGNIDRPGLSALWLLKFLPNTALAAIARLTGVKGENAVVGTACAASLQALGQAFRFVRDGYGPAALAGGGDSRLSHGGVLAYAKAGALAPLPECGNPGAACRPFDMRRSGFVPGEGGAFFVLEERESALARGARVHAEVLGFGATLDGGDPTAPSEDGRDAERAVRRALADAGAGPESVDIIFAHGTGTPRNDAAEAAMLARLFPHRPGITALKSWIGHLSAACGAVELAIGIGCLRSRFLPGIRNLETPQCDALSLSASHRQTMPMIPMMPMEPMIPTMRDRNEGTYPHGENSARASQKAEGMTVLIENFGFGGQNAALLLRAGSETPLSEELPHPVPQSDNHRKAAS